MNNLKNHLYKRIEIQNACLITPFQEIPGGTVVIEADKVTAIKRGHLVKRGAWFTASEKEDSLVIDACGNYVAPGFIDLHVHGSGGWDVMDGTAGAINSLAQSLALGGTTAFLPTVMTASEDHICKSLKALAVSMKMGTDGARLLGIHLEGPFLNKTKAGIQPLEYISEPMISKLENYLEIAEGLINLITLAPEVEGALEMIEWAISRGIICSMGHTAATYEEVVKACESGLTQATHAFNAMELFHHRNPGALGALLTIDKLTAEVIADPAHIHPAALQLLLKAKGLTGLHLVSDAIRATGLPDGNYDFAGGQINVKQGVAKAPDGTLAGSTLTMAGAVRNAMLMGKLTLSQAVQLATINPARTLGTGDIMGSLEAGKSADLVILDPNLTPMLTMVAGKTVYQAF